MVCWVCDVWVAWRRCCSAACLARVVGAGCVLRLCYVGVLVALAPAHLVGWSTAESCLPPVIVYASRLHDLLVITPYSWLVVKPRTVFQNCARDPDSCSHPRCPAPQPELRPGALCVAQYSLDKQWYRGYVEKAHGLAGQYDVFFIDYGNRWGCASASRLRRSGEVPRADGVDCRWCWLWEVDCRWCWLWEFNRQQA